MNFPWDFSKPPPGFPPVPPPDPTQSGHYSEYPYFPYQTYPVAQRSEFPIYSSADAYYNTEFQAPPPPPPPGTSESINKPYKSERRYDTSDSKKDRYERERSYSKYSRDYQASSS